MGMMLRRYHPEPDSNTESGPAGQADDEKPLAKRTNAEIEAYAEANNIDLDGATKKADMLAAIEKAEQKS